MIQSDVDVWTKQWGGKLYASYGTTHSKGLVILINRNCKVENVKIQINTERILSISFVYQNKNLNIFNVYAPNQDKDKLDFLGQVENQVNLVEQGDGIIIAGDFNMVLDNKLDIISGHPHDSRIVTSFDSMLSSLDVYDIWRLLHSEEKRYTWCKHNPFIARRLDYILVSEQLLSKIITCDITPAPHTDHDGVSLEIQLQEIKRGNSFWKFNENLLKSPKYVEIVKNVISEFENMPVNVSAQQRWDLCKLHIKEISINFSKKQAKIRKDDLKLLETRLKMLECTLSTDPNNENAREQMNDTKLALDLYALQLARGAQIRSRIRWIEEGEKNTKYFLNLEKANASSGVITALKDANSELQTNQNEIINILHNYYSHLYSKKFDISSVTEYIHRFCNDIDIPQLCERDRESCEGPATYEELEFALKHLNISSAPGSDGLTLPFYKHFWVYIKDMVLKSINSALETGSLSTLQRQGIIILFHKGKQTSRNDLTNWRPITLTNTDYKLITKVLARRMQAVIKSIIHENQVGYVRGRTISTIIRTIDDVIEFIDVSNETGAIIALDYAKAFDSVNKQFLCKVFNMFGFGRSFIQWVSTITENTVSCVSHCGWRTAYFNVDSGIRQGCPFSPLAFILAVEILALKIRQNGGVAGIRLPSINPNDHTSIKILQYADDTTLFLRDRNDILNGLTLVKQYSKFSGLTMNRNKTEAMWLGRDKNSKQKVTDITWKVEDPHLKILGVTFRNDRRASEIKENWDNRIQRVIHAIKSWEKRDLSIVGKIHIVKTFMISQFVYLMQSIGLPDMVLKEINTMLFKFVWKKRYNNRRAFEKVRRNVLCGNTDCGGLNMINIVDMQHSFYIAWMSKLWHNHSAFWATIPLYYLFQLGQDFAVLRANVHKKEFIGLYKIKSEFWKKTIIAWLDHHKVYTYDDITADHIKNQSLWNNSIIRYQGRVLFFTKWLANGILTVGDLYNGDQIMSFPQLEDKMGRAPALLLQYNVVINALPHEWRNIAQDATYNRSPSFLENDISVLSSPKVRELITKRKWKQPCSVNFWTNKYVNVQLDSRIWNLAFTTVKESRLRVLQWKILHNIYPTQILLMKMGVTDNNQCVYCNEIDYIEHFFYGCNLSRNLWSHVENTILVKHDIQIQLEEETVMFGLLEGYNKSVRKTVNTYILIGKMCVSKFKYGSYNNIRTLFDYECALREKL